MSLNFFQQFLFHLGLFGSFQIMTSSKSTRLYFYLDLIAFIIYVKFEAIWKFYGKMKFKEISNNVFHLQ